MVNFAMGNVKKWGKILAILVIGLVVVVNSISSGLSAVASIVPSTPKVSEEDKKEILRLMKEMDETCGKKLSEGYTLVGSKDTNWKAVLSIYFAYYNNDLVNKSTGTYMDMIEEASRKYGVDKWINQVTPDYPHTRGEYRAAFIDEWFKPVNDVEDE